MTVPLVIDVGGESLPGDLTIPADAVGIIVFAHGSGSSRHSPRNIAVARTLQDYRFGTLLFDLLTEGEDDRRFDVDLLTRRLLHVLDDLTRRDSTANLPVGLFGASTGAAAAVGAAAAWPEEVRAVVARGGRPDLAAAALPRVTAPTLMIVGGKDPEVQRLNEEAAARMGGPAEVRIVPGATHLFEEQGTLEAAAEMAATWFTTHLI
ncbi:dienelactone hydrolase family protein [Amycolatopsis acidiphila]|uniref:Alpha/beta hydrolase n=1 Tax=Amycolatopsis acidiphila TaxID=715473 RepID=A0A558AN46_9PSEU|nr:alpha/beta family hydrolase [Amycolatopsis acidiphila]TVT25688.1 alpha/beta hydrolase [Amycolatopsis acidiphila]UIJ60445.1 dienelactone hydrolase family protein [Amycolatopsis acidiphila]GHG82854.1 hydrolase [Amycolatopsis acidiphila]